jgi:hypothetical protein
MQCRADEEGSEGGVGPTRRPFLLVFIVLT